MNNENQLKTGLWITKSKNGAEYYSGKITITKAGTYRVALFRNNNKLSEKSPDFNISLSEATQQTSQNTTQPVITNDPLANFSSDIVLTDQDLPF